MKNFLRMIVPLAAFAATACTKTGDSSRVVSAAMPAGAASLYQANCATCHQADGGGMPGAYPPLAGSEWVRGIPATLVAQVLKGAVGEIIVRGAKYKGAMPSVSHLKDEEIAAILTYVRGSWGNKATAVTPEFVAKIRAKLKDRVDPWKDGGELLRATADLGK